MRWRLLMLCVAGLLPLLVAAAATVAYVVQERDRAMARNALVLARSVGASVQAELDAAIAALEALGDAESLSAGRLAAFRDHASTVAQKRHWRTITLIDASGRLLFSTDDPGAAGQMAWERASVDETLARHAPTVGAVVRGKLTPAPAFPIRIPVTGAGAVKQVLSAVVGTDQVLELVQRQRLSSGYVVAVFDAAGTRIARSADHATGRASPSLQALIDAGGDEGAGLTRTLEGQVVHTAFHRIPLSRWVVAVGVPASEARNVLLATAATALAGLLGSLLLAAGLAWVFARRVSRPIDELKRAAQALGRGERVQALRIDIEELRDVGDALTRAAGDREQAGAEREELLARAVEALKQAEDAARSKDEFLAVLGHELRNPLAPIASALKLMAVKGDGATAAERRIVERQLAHMTRLVDDLLDVSRITRRQLRIHKAPMQVGPWIEQAVQAVRGSGDARHVDVDLSPEAAESWIDGDEVRLAQVLSNLLGNAVKFTAAGGRVTVRARRERADVVVDVEDDGVGLDPEQAGKVFDLFYQAPQALDRARGGLGLGLPIVRSLVEMHAGTVAAASDGPGKGSRFTVRLPCVDAPAREALPEKPAPATASPVARRVLVVDDNQDAADTAAALLEISGHRVRVAYTPQQALDALDGFDAEVAVLDIGLPGMDGYELARAIRRRPGCARIRLVALTGYGQDSDVGRARDAGFDAHLTKPVAPDVLLQVVDASQA